MYNVFRYKSTIGSCSINRSRNTQTRTKEKIYIFHRRVSRLKFIWSFFPSSQRVKCTLQRKPSCAYFWCNLYIVKREKLKWNEPDYTRSYLYYATCQSEMSISNVRCINACYAVNVTKLSLPNDATNQPF